MTIENGNKKEWDDRYPKSIDDCSPAEWDAVRDKCMAKDTVASPLESVYAKNIKRQCQTGDLELDHINRDRFLIKFLREAGFNEIADAAEYVEDKIGFWYA